MRLYDAAFLFLFLPVFFAVYAVTPSSKRPLILTLANLIFICLCDTRGLAVIMTDFLVAYFSAINIYNLRNDRKKQRRRTRLMLFNFGLNCAVFLIFVILSLKPVSDRFGLAVFGGAVIPLHLISYLSDVYRGKREPQTKICTLFSYAAFFPSMTIGPVMKYRRVEKSFLSPKLSLEKLALGIRFYIFGLVEYLVIGGRLRGVCSEMLTSEKTHCDLLSLLLCSLIFYVTFVLSVMGILHIGEGISQMLGIEVRPTIRRSSSSKSFAESIRGLNKTLYSWGEDYLYKPFSGASNAVKIAVGAGSIIFMSVWYGKSPIFLPTGALAALFVVVQQLYFKKHAALPKAVRYVSTKVLIALTAVFCTMGVLSGVGIPNGSVIPREGAGLGYFYYLVKISIVPLVIGIFVISSVLPRFFKKLGETKLYVLMPIAEGLLLIVAAAWMSV